MYCVRTYRLHAIPSLDQRIEKEHDSYLLGQLKYAWSGRNGEGERGRCSEGRGRSGGGAVKEEGSEGGAVKEEGSEEGKCSEGRGGAREVQ